MARTSTGAKPKGLSTIVSRPDTATAEPPSASALRGRAFPLIGLLAAALFVLSWWDVGVDFGQFAGGWQRIGTFFSYMAPPDLSIVEVVVRATVETLEIAYLGTVLSALASLVLGLMAAVNLTPAWVHLPAKWLLAALRSIPLILIAPICIVAVGFGPTAGVLTIAIHATGMLGKFYAEAFENADPAPLEALESVGATWAQKIRFGALSQAAPDLVRDTLFRFELNFRDSMVLGLVGAGGIGFYLQLYLRSFNHQKVATLTIVVLLMVVAIEQLSIWGRRWLR